MMTMGLRYVTGEPHVRRSDPPSRSSAPSVWPLRALHGLRSQAGLSQRSATALRLRRSWQSAVAEDVEGVSDGVLTQDRLMEVTGLRQKAALRRHLKRAGIPFRELGGRITTTVEAFNATLVGREKNKHKGPNFDALTTEGAE